MPNNKLPLFQIILNLLTKENDRENILAQFQGKIEISHNELFKFLTALLLKSGIPDDYRDRFIAELMLSISQYLPSEKNRVWLKIIKSYALLFQELEAQQHLLEFFNSAKGNDRKRFMLFQLLTNMGIQVSLEPEEWLNLKV